MKKVLVVAGKMYHGGLETMIMNFFRNLDREQVMFDFLLHYEEPGEFDEEIKRLGGKIYIMPRPYPKNVFRYIRALNRFFKAHRGEYDIVHGHLTSVGAIYLTIARLHGVKTRAIHAHYTATTGNHHQRLERLMLFPLRACANFFFACSKKAGQFCYGKNILTKSNYKTLHNGIDLKRFAFSRESREKMRRTFAIGPDCRVLLHVGRFEKQKNHKKLIDIFAAFLNTHPDAVLLLVGEGSLKKETEEYAKSLGLGAVVRFLGVREDVDSVMQAADVFVMPSLYEGLPVAGVEAQAAGLPLVMADTVTEELNILGNCVYVPLNAENSVWASEIAKFDTFVREPVEQKMRDKGYDIVASAKWLEHFYLTH